VTLAEDLVRQAGAPPRAASRDGRRPNRLGWILAGLILLGCVLFVDLDDVARTLGRLTPVELALLLLVSTADRLLMGYKWALLLRTAAPHMRYLYMRHTPRAY
jgi:hypothetical protein